jgi:RIO kinase 1
MLQDEILFSSLQELIDRGSITEVVSVLKSGKEATVCCCRDGQGGLVAAKVYRPLEHRRFRNDQVYRGGKVLKGRAQRALDNKSEHGRAVQLGTWQHYEWETMNLMHEIGSDVPRPIERSSGVIVMEYVGGDESTPAPQLRAVRSMSAGEAHELFERLMWNVELWLAHNRIHGDLSPFNVLYWRGRPVVIDFPQAVDPRENPMAYSMLSRDIENVWRYCSRFGVTCDPWKIASRLWSRFLRAEL